MGPSSQFGSGSGLGRLGVEGWRAVCTGSMLGLGGGCRSKVSDFVPRLCGSFLGGRASLDPGPVLQVDPLQVRMICWKAVSLSAGISSDLTLLPVFVQSKKQ